MRQSGLSQVSMQQEGCGGMVQHRDDGFPVSSHKEASHSSKG
jgi:hypothetical protein